MYKQTSHVASGTRVDLDDPDIGDQSFEALARMHKQTYDVAGVSTSARMTLTSAASDMLQTRGIAGGARVGKDDPDIDKGTRLKIARTLARNTKPGAGDHRVRG